MCYAYADAELSTQLQIHRCTGYRTLLHAHAPPYFRPQQPMLPHRDGTVNLCTTELSFRTGSNRVKQGRPKSDTGEQGLTQANRVKHSLTETIYFASTVFEFRTS